MDYRKTLEVVARTVFVGHADVVPFTEDEIEDIYIETAPEYEKIGKSFSNANVGTRIGVAIILRQDAFERFVTTIESGRSPYKRKLDA